MGLLVLTGPKLGGYLSTEQQLNAFLAAEEKQAFRIAQVSTGAADDALDIIQDAMIKFVEKYSHKPQQDWKPLFYRIVNTRIIDWHRRKKVKSSVLSFFGFHQESGVGMSVERGERKGGNAQVIEQAPAPELSPEEQMKADSAIGVLELAIQQLPLRQQQAVMHRLWDGMDTASTATAMGVSAGSVKTHYSRGLKTLQQLLGEHWP